MYNIRSIFSSIIDFNNDQKAKKYITDNFMFLLKSRVTNYDWEGHDDRRKIFKYILEHHDKFLDIPSFSRLKLKFSEEPDVIDELDRISKESPLFATNFISTIEEVFYDEQKKSLVRLLKDTNSISEGGRDHEGKEVKSSDGKTKLKGPKDAVEYFLSKSDQYTKSERNVISEGVLSEHADESYSRYLDNKTKPRQGMLTGFQTIDFNTFGIRSGELWLIVAYVAELKTTLSMNFAYTQAIEQGKNVQFVSLEMDFKTVKDLFIIIHSCNMNLWINSEWSDVFPLCYTKFQNGEFNEREEDFYKFLCDDLNNPEYGKINIYQPIDSITINQFKIWATNQYKKEPFDIIYLDYIELIKSIGPIKDYGLELNQRIKDLKQFALNFNDGQGTSIVSAYQTNRKGKEHADKNNGEYRLDGLSYANEAERSADCIVSSYLNPELREKSKVKINCLKYRYREPFKQFLASTYLSSRKVFELVEGDGVISKIQVNKRKKLSQEELVNSIL